MNFKLIKKNKGRINKKRQNFLLKKENDNENIEKKRNVNQKELKNKVKKLEIIKKENTISFCKNKAKYKKIIKNILILIIIQLIYMLIKKYIILLLNHKNKEQIEKKKYYEKEKFAILRRTGCRSCGLFSYYLVYMGCINKFLGKGYIPIVDLISFENTYNNFTISNNSNPWEIFFEQPFGYTLEEVLKTSNFQYFECTDREDRPNEIFIYFNKVAIDFWRGLAMKYCPLKKEIITEANIIMKQLFKGSDNILGVKIRGTDYIASKIHGHPIPPKIDDVISDVKKMQIKNNYDWIFFASEDKIFKEKFINEFKGKIKYLNPKKDVDYDYNKRQVITYQISGNLEYTKNYVINIYILSKCTDIIMSRCSGAAGVILLNNGFRNSLIYKIGEN